MLGSSRLDSPFASTFLVVTTVNEPTPAMLSLAAGSSEHGNQLVVVGDEATPSHYRIEGAVFLDLEAQSLMGSELAAIEPIGHYARKNVGYLHAMAEGADVIIETDDDNHPMPSFFEERTRRITARSVTAEGWVNVYNYFRRDGDDVPIWPRGYPLDAIHQTFPRAADHGDELHDCPIQQGLANEDPDVDAIYRLVGRLPYSFESGVSVVLRPGAWCPFNSQNTTWFRDAFRLMYLPAHCPFRLTDIWRSLVAQRIAWENGWCILFRSADVWQDRNEHDLMADFTDEIAGYLHNRELAERLMALKIEPGLDGISESMRRCYRELLEMGLVGAEEMALLAAWQRDTDRLLGGG
jgi:hypothetical protein